MAKFLSRAKLKSLIPPILMNWYQDSRRKYGFFGNYLSWEEALKNSDGYNSDIILNKVKDALLQVKEGKAVYERDSVLFDKVEYSFPVLAALLKIALENDGKLSVLDFGGSLGSSYFQCRNFLAGVKELRWSIVEQPNFVQCGKQYFEDEKLKFYEDIESCLECEKPDVILLSGVIQYLNNPLFFVDSIIDFNFQYIVIDILACFKKFKYNNRLTIQYVDPIIYDAKYPAWIFNTESFLSHFRHKYNLVADFSSLYSADLNFLDAELRGFIFQKIAF